MSELTNLRTSFVVWKGKGYPEELKDVPLTTFDLDGQTSEEILIKTIKNLCAVLAMAETAGTDEDFYPRMLELNEKFSLKSEIKSI